MVRLLCNFPPSILLSNSRHYAASKNRIHVPPLALWQANFIEVLQIVARQIACPTPNERHTRIPPYPPRCINRIYHPSKPLHVPYLDSKIRLPYQCVRSFRHDPTSSRLCGGTRRNGVIISRVGGRYRSNR